MTTDTLSAEAHSDNPVSRTRIIHYLSILELARCGGGKQSLDVMESALLTTGRETYLETIFDSPESYNNYCDVLDKHGWVVGNENAFFRMIVDETGKLMFRYSFEEGGKTVRLGIVVEITKDKKISLTDDLLDQLLVVTL